MRPGGWMPESHAHMQDFMGRIHGKANSSKPLLPCLQEFKDLIEGDEHLYLLFSLMFEEIPDKYKNDPAGHHQVRHYTKMLDMLNHILREAPEFNSGPMVGTPITAIFDYAMGTEAGFAAFTNERVNMQIKKILGEWARFLGSPDSCYVLTADDETGWFSKQACSKMFHDDTTKFEDVFVCAPREPHYGYRSWDEFFTRQFKEGQRPVASPEDDSVVVNACEAAPYRVAENIQYIDRFWIKKQPYSLRHLLQNDPSTDKFVGGSIYQAFLSAMNYHRWNSPVSGTIVRAYLVQGTYYSEPPSESYDKIAPTSSQAYLAELATRAVILIEADNKDIGLMCFVGIGMVEVSTCDIRVYEGQKVKKGDELGMFHYGGSTYCLIFGPHVRAE